MWELRAASVIIGLMWLAAYAGGSFEATCAYLLVGATYAAVEYAHR